MFYTDIMQSFKAPDGFFNVTFLEVIRSKYRKAVSFRHGATQQEVLTSPKWEEEDRRHEVQDFLVDHPSGYYLFDENPLDFGYFLDTITSEGM